jgi:TrmH family RNA methyltransferase
MTPVERYRRARRDPGLVVLEGFHALKHALRFGAEVVEVAVVDPEALAGLARALAPDVLPHLPRLPLFVPDAGLFARLGPVPHPTGVLALARRPAVGPVDVLAARGPVVVLDRPARLDNVGAVVRVAAAAGAGGVLCLGPADPYNPVAVRGAAGLQLALKVARAEAPGDALLAAAGRPLVALSPEGEPLGPGVLPPDALLLFGTEREGLSSPLLARATRRVRIPMREGVSSLNLATAVAVTLYAAPTAGR